MGAIRFIRSYNRGVRPVSARLATDAVTASRTLRRLIGLAGLILIFLAPVLLFGGFYLQTKADMEYFGICGLVLAVAALGYGVYALKEWVIFEFPAWVGKRVVQDLDKDRR